jgi:hypothetical protein
VVAVYATRLPEDSSVSDRDFMELPAAPSLVS